MNSLYTTNGLTPGLIEIKYRKHTLWKSRCKNDCLLYCLILFYL